MAAERAVVPFDGARTGGATRSVDEHAALAALVVAQLTSWWPDKVGRVFAGNPKVATTFSASLARGLAERRIGRKQVMAGLRRIEADGAEWPPLEVPRLLRFFSPVPDYEAAFAEAQRHAVARLYGDVVAPGVWSHPALYWAAERFGWFELRNASWEQARRRWPAVLEEVLAWGEWPAIARAALPDEDGLQTRAVQQRELAKMRSLLAGKGDRGVMLK